MRLRLIAAILAACALALAGCREVTAGASGGVPVFAGGIADVPTESGAGTWVHIAGSDSSPVWMWAAAGAAGGSLALAASKALKSVATSGHGNAAVIVNDPCAGQKRNFKVATWKVPVPKGSKPNWRPNLNCGDMRALLRRHGTPARFRYVYDCIANIFANATSVTYGKFGPGRPMTPRVGYGWEGNWMTTTPEGTVKEMGLKNGWGNCARGA